ncbi:MAG: hypothetical protein KAY64_03425, partial [Anaerolineales bacterium]|nr:hypothetical protein [Anaerolineales bacterium]
MNRLFTCISLIILFTSACTAAAPTAAVPLDQAAPSGSVLFQDDFANPASGWNRFSATEGVMDYDGGSYRM